MGDRRGVESKEKHPTCSTLAASCMLIEIKAAILLSLVNSMGLLFSEVWSVLWIPLSSIAFYDLEVITKWTNGLAKHISPLNILEA